MTHEGASSGRLKPLNRQPCSMVQFPTVKPPSVVDPCGSRATSKSTIGPRIGLSFSNSPLIFARSSSSGGLVERGASGQARSVPLGFPLLTDPLPRAFR